MRSVLHAAGHLLVGFAALVAALQGEVDTVCCIVQPVSKDECEVMKLLRIVWTEQP